MSTTTISGVVHRDYPRQTESVPRRRQYVCKLFCYKVTAVEVEIRIFAHSAVEPDKGLSFDVSLNFPEHVFLFFCGVLIDYIREFG